MNLSLDAFFNFHAFYIISVSLISLAIYAFASFRIDRLRQKRLIGLKRKHLDAPVDTETPLDEPEKQQRKIGQESIETRFSFLQKFLPIVFGVAWLSVVIIPYLTRVPAIHVSLVIGSISVLIGIAARPFIENIISGLVISFAQPIRIGDTVLINDYYGVIEDIKLTHSVINIWDWRRLVIPNSQMLSKEIINYSLNDHHLWAWIEFHVSADSNLEEIEEVAKKVAKTCEHYLDVEEPSFWVMGLEKDSIRCWLASWTDGPTTAWAMRAHMRSELAKYFRKQNIQFNMYNINQGVTPPPSETRSEVSAKPNVPN